MKKIGLIIFGIIIAVLFLEIALRVSGYIILELKEWKNLQVLKERGVYRILCLGDSTTAPVDKYCYPTQLENILNERSKNIKFRVINKGVSGATTTFIIAQLENNLNLYNPDMVISMMGINDVVFSSVPYNDSLSVKLVMFFKNLRVYKLARIIWLNIINGIIQMKECKADVEYGDVDGNEEFLSEIEGLKYKALIYQNEGNFEKTENILKKALKLARNSSYESELYGWLAELYVGFKKFKKAELMYRKGLELEPDNAYLFAHWGDCYLQQKKFDKAEHVLKKSIKIDPTYKAPYNILILCYKEQKEFGELEKLCKQIEGLDKKNDYFYSVMGTIYNIIGKSNKMSDKIEEYYDRANNFRLKHYIASTRKNYKKLKEIVLQRGIKLVCVQYPLRGVESLKKLVEAEPNVTFLDNEGIFKKALRLGKYDDYFIDNFGGDFGHCTPRGNRLLAENVANVILGGYFNLKN